MHVSIFVQISHLITNPGLVYNIFMLQVHLRFCLFLIISSQTRAWYCVLGLSFSHFLASCSWSVFHG
jgi:hypothetical protein